MYSRHNHLGGRGELCLLIQQTHTYCVCACCGAGGAALQPAAGRLQVAAYELRWRLLLEAGADAPTLPPQSTNTQLPSHATPMPLRMPRLHGAEHGCRLHADATHSTRFPPTPPSTPPPPPPDSAHPCMQATRRCTWLPVTCRQQRCRRCWRRAQTRRSRTAMPRCAPCLLALPVTGSMFRWPALCICVVRALCLLWALCLEGQRCAFVWCMRSACYGLSD